CQPLLLQGQSEIANPRDYARTAIWPGQVDQTPHNKPRPSEEAFLQSKHSQFTEVSTHTHKTKTVGANLTLPLQSPMEAVRVCVCTPHLRFWVPPCVFEFVRGGLIGLVWMEGLGYPSGFATFPAGTTQAPISSTQ
ncbi:G polyprotein, partial [Dissostichus eleginoides]